MYNLEAEQAVIGCVLLEASWGKESVLRPEHFFDQAHAAIWEAIMITAHDGDKPTDVVSVASELSIANRLDFVGGVNQLARLAKSVPTTAQFEFYQRLVLEAWKLRKADDIMQRGREEISATQEQEAISATIKQLTDIEESGTKKQGVTMREAAMQVFEDIEGAMNRTEEISGIATGYTDFDRMTNGLQQEELIIVAARPSVGKTAWCLNLAMGAVDPKINTSFPVSCDIFSLEMGVKPLTNRMICAKGKIDATHIKNPRRFMRNDEDWTNLTLATSMVSEMDIEIHDDPVITVPEMRSIVRRRVRKARQKNPKAKHLVIIDYLQLIRPAFKASSRQEEVSEISRSLKQMSRELNVCVVALSQLSRGVEQRQDKRPMLSDLRESGSIEQDADIVAFLYRDDYYNADSDMKNIIEIIIGKQRNGPVGTVELVFLKNFNKFVNYERVNYGDARTPNTGYSSNNGHTSHGRDDDDI